MKCWSACGTMIRAASCCRPILVTMDLRWNSSTVRAAKGSNSICVNYRLAVNCAAWTGILILRTEWGPGDVQQMGGLDAWEATCFGYCLLRGDEILCSASMGPAALGLREPGVFTPEAHRSNGYATITSARLIQEIERLGHQTYWDCARQNGASAAVARKLGYRIEKEYRVLAWDKLPRPTGTTKL